MSRTSKLWQMYMITYSNFMIIIKPYLSYKTCFDLKISPEKYNFIVRTNYRHPKMDVTEFKHSSEKNNEQWKTVFLLGNFRPDAL